ncbi:MAG: ABC transporter ATP-binding protein [Spirochaetota bacterium]
MEEQMSGNVIETRGLTLYYGRHRGIQDVDLAVVEGEVFGFLGPNGAGKTTTQRVLLDVIRATSGTASIFGLDSRKDGPAIRSRIGYLPGDLALPGQMTGRRFLSLMSSLESRPVDAAFRDELCERLELDPDRKIREYSRGNRQKVGVVAAFMSRPDLVILDEPTTGLDPLIQQRVMELVREVRADGRTVFFSSHVLHEVQSVCDRVGIIREGALVKTETVEALTRRQFTRLRLTLRTPPAADAFARTGVTEVSRDGNTVLLEVRSELDAVLRRALEYGVDDVATEPVTLEEVFLAFYGERSNAAVSGRANGGTDA